MKRLDAAVISMWVAHTLAWIVALGLTFGPIYQGVSVTAAIPGDVASESTRVSATLIDVNGLRVLPLLLAPVVLTALALLAVLLTDAWSAKRKALVWVSAVLLLGFCALGSFSIGLFYLPAALALTLSAILGSRRRSPETRTGQGETVNGP